MEVKTLKRIAILTSGGDAPGMNAAIRAVVRTGIYHGLEVVGIRQGYKGLLGADFIPLNLRSVANIIQRGGTFLKTARCPEFHQPENRQRAIQQLQSVGIDGLVCIGGDGTYRGADLLFKEHKLPVVGIPGTIDNDIEGTEATIGFDTAINTALEAIDRVRDTAASHNRLFIVEVMGHNSGFIATHVAVAGGAEQVFIPDHPFDINQVTKNIQMSASCGKGSSILIAAEGKKPGRAYDLAEQIRKKSGQEAKVCVLGHLQRGGTPTAVDRILASRMGAAAVEALLAGQHGQMIGWQRGGLVVEPLELGFKSRNPPNPDLIQLISILSH